MGCFLLMGRPLREEYGRALFVGYIVASLMAD